MTATPPADTPDSDPLSEAEARLLAAIGAVETRLGQLSSRMGEAEGDARAARHADEDRSRLAEQLDAARASEAELAEAASEASAALAEAMSELKAAIAGAGLADSGPDDLFAGGGR
ncbi:MAG: DUF4164 family protein [Glycocaulis sp.]|uniref:DUF4164 family protein n=1 Tax=Glycocaulis sp. TaxID=1969725 RepID=UPI003F70EB70